MGIYYISTINGDFPVRYVNLPEAKPSRCIGVPLTAEAFKGLAGLGDAEIFSCLGTLGILVVLGAGCDDQ